MTNAGKFSDEDLVAFLDGEHEHIAVEDIQEALKSDPGLQARIDAMSMDTQAVKNAFDFILDAAPEMPDLPEAAPAPAPASMAGKLKLVAASAALFLMVGLGAGFYFGQTLVGQNGPENWREFVAVYQALYINDTLAGIDQNADEAGIELARVSQSIGKTLDLGDLVQQDQLDYKRAQILGFEGKPLAQLTFLSDAGEPIALCIIRSTGQGTKEIVISEMLGMQAASWSRDGYEYLLIGGGNAALIKDAANAFARKL